MFCFFKAAKYNRQVVRKFLNVKHYVVLPFSSRWRKWATPQAQRQESLFKLESAQTQIEWGMFKTLCVCVFVCLCLCARKCD